MGEDPGVAGLKGKAGQIQDHAKEALHAAGTKMHRVGEQVKDKAHDLGDRARRGAADLGNRSRQLYRDGRQRVAATIEQRPLESGLVCLALGLIAGVALPTSARVRQTVAPRARQLRRQAKEMASRGSVVLDRATEAAKTEAQAQGFTRGGSTPAPGADARKPQEFRADTAVSEGMAGTPAPMGAAI